MSINYADEIGAIDGQGLRFISQGKEQQSKLIILIIALAAIAGRIRNKHKACSTTL